MGKLSYLDGLLLVPTSQYALDGHCVMKPKERKSFIKSIKSSGNLKWVDLEVIYLPRRVFLAVSLHLHYKQHL